MNIVHVVFSFNSGGIENLLVDVINNWKKSDQIMLCIINDVKNDKLISKISNSNAKVICLERRPKTSLLPFVKKFKKIIKDFNADIIHCHTNNAFRFALPVKILCPKVKMFLTVHSRNNYTKNSTIDVLIHKLFLNNITAISNSVKQDILDRGYPEKKITLIHNGIDIKKFSAEKSETENKIIICVARLFPEQKGQDILIRALGELKNIRKDFKCIFVGDAPVNNEYILTDFKKLASDLYVKENIEFLGDRNDVPELLSKATVFVLPSRYEGFGISLIEAMYSKIPVIASNIDGPKEIIGDNKYGFLFESENYRELAEVLNSVLDMDNGELVEKAYDYAVENFSIQVMNRKLNELYMK